MGEEGSYGRAWLWEATFPWLPSPDLASSPNSTPLCMGPCSEEAAGTLKSICAPLDYNPATSVQKKARYQRGGWGIGFVTWFCRTLVSLCLGLVSSAARLWMKCMFPKPYSPLLSLESPFPLPLLLSPGEQVSSAFHLAKGVDNTTGERRSHWPTGKPWGGDGAGSIRKQRADGDGTMDLPVT